MYMYYVSLHQNQLLTYYSLKSCFIVSKQFLPLFTRCSNIVVVVIFGNFDLSDVPPAVGNSGTLGAWSSGSPSGFTACFVLAASGFFDKTGPCDKKHTHKIKHDQLFSHSTPGEAKKSAKTYLSRSSFFLPVTNAPERLKYSFSSFTDHEPLGSSLDSFFSISKRQQSMKPKQNLTAN